MSSPPLATLDLGDDLTPGFDLFTPHIRALCLGGVRVHEGGWTAGELINKLRGVAEDTSIAVERGGGFAQLTAQLNSLRCSLVSSMLGLMESSVALVLLDARLGEAWLESSLDAACAELKVWYEAHQHAQYRTGLRLCIWVELPAPDSLTPQLEQEIERSITRLQRLIRLYQAQLLFMERGFALTQPKDTRRLWCRFTGQLSDCASDEDLWSEQRACLDSFAPLKAGSFYQGGGRLTSSVERPQHRVKLTHDLWVSQAPVTRGLWSAVMGEEVIRYEGEVHAELLPIANISWFDSLRFCNQLSLLEGLEPAYEIENHALPKVTWKRDRRGYRLLTEAEWEYACRGRVISSPTAPTSTLPRGWTSDRARLSAHPVAQLDPNGWGLYDCIGNVSEWCQDAYSADIYQKRAQERICVDPCEYDASAPERVIRGGAFDTEPYLATPSRRDSCSPRAAWSSVGLRITRPL